MTVKRKQSYRIKKKKQEPEVLPGQQLLVQESKPNFKKTPFIWVASHSVTTATQLNRGPRARRVVSHPR